MGIPVLRSNPNPLALLAGSFGKGVANRVGEEANYQRDRGRVNSALESLNTENFYDESGNVDPLRAIKGLIGATAGIPGGQQIVSELYPALMQQLSNRSLQQQGRPMPGGQGMPAAEQPYVSPLDRRQDQQQPAIEKRQMPQPSAPIFAEGVAPPSWGEQPVPNIFSPEQILDYTRELANRNVPPEQIQESRREMDEYNERQRAAVRDREASYQTANQQIEQKARILDLQNNALDRLLPRDATPEDQDLLRLLSKKHQGLDNINDFSRAAYNDYIHTKASLHEMEKTVKRGFFSNPDKVKTAQQQAKKFVERGLTPLVAETLQKAGYGPAEYSEIILPLQAPVKREFDKFGKFTNALDTKNLPGTPGFEEDTRRNYEKRAQQIDQFKDLVKKNLKPGSTSKDGVYVPKTSLRLMHDMAVQKGLTWEEATNLITDMVRAGDIKLEDDPYHELEFNMLGKKPDVTLSEYLGGKR